MEAETRLRARAGTASPPGRKSKSGEERRRSQHNLATLHRALGIPADYAIARGLPLHREATRLAVAGRSPTGKVIRLTPVAATAWKRLRTAAAREGVVLLPISGFRSVRRQAMLIRRKLAAGEPITAVLHLVAAPGYSEHHTGRALDLGSPGCADLDENFARTPAYRWLLRHARNFGFHLSYPRRNRHGIAFEPWHWCWRPRGK